MYSLQVQRIIIALLGSKEPHLSEVQKLIGLC
jgi:hypothetical protein